MRPIKFRLWDGKFMRYTFFQITNDGLPEDRHGPMKGELMQFTGLLDKNGKEIYEGDILDMGFLTEKGKVWMHRLCFVDFVKGEFVRDYSRSPNARDYHLPVHSLWTDSAESIIIGNIYENPELLK